MFHLFSINKYFRKNIETLASMCVPFLLVGTTAALLSVAGPDAGRQSQTAPAHLTPLALRHHIPRHVHQKLDDSTYTSVNWTGYAVTGAQGSVTDVKASWVVPAVSCTAADVPNVFASFWTGIDGWTSSTVEQIGTDSDCQDYQGTYTPGGYYYAWFEFYPQQAYYIGDPTGGFKGKVVSVGDTISAEVKYTGATSGGPRQSVRGGSTSRQFTVTITDTPQTGTGWTFTYSSSVRNAQQSSAEWIAETPYGCGTSSGYCYLPNFSSVQFKSSSATVNGGVPEPVGSFGNSVQQSIMVDANAPNNNIPSADIMAEPSPACPVYGTTLITGRRGNLCSSTGDIMDLGGSTGSSFGVQYYSAGP